MGDAAILHTKDEKSPKDAGNGFVPNCQTSMPGWRFPLRLSDSPATSVQNDNLVWCFHPFKAGDVAEQVAEPLYLAEMMLATPADVAKLSFVAST